MKLPQRRMIFFYTFLLIICTNIQAQVIIGAEGEPEEFIALKIVSTSGGLRYPQLSSAQISTLNGIINNSSLAEGLMIFNTDGTGSLQYYKGAGNWVNLTAIRGVAKSEKEQNVNFDGENNILVEDLHNNNYQKEYTIKTTDQHQIKLIKVGKYLDYENIIKKIDFNSDDLSNGSKINIEFHPKIKDFFELNNNKQGFISARIYAKYLENGVEKQVDFDIQITNADQ